MTKPIIENRSEAAVAIKRAASKLFAEHGVDGATVRDIAEAAGQKNHAAVGYYFGSKDDLVREIILDGAILIDNRRNAALDKLEAAGGPHTIREVMEVLVHSSLDLSPQGEPETYNRFIVMLTLTRWSYVMEVLGNEWNSGYLRCLDHLRRLTPDLPADIQNQRFVFLSGCLGGVIATREFFLSDASRGHPMWSEKTTLDDFVQSLTVMMDMPLTEHRAETG